MDSSKNVVQDDGMDQVAACDHRSTDGGRAFAAQIRAAAAAAAADESPRCLCSLVSRVLREFYKRVLKCLREARK